MQWKIYTNALCSLLLFFPLHLHNNDHEYQNTSTTIFMVLNTNKVQEIVETMCLSLGHIEIL